MAYDITIEIRTLTAVGVNNHSPDSGIGEGKMRKWDELASDEEIQNVVKALKENGIDAIVVNNGEGARERVLELIPKGAEVMDMTSMTLAAIGVSKDITESGNYNSVRNRLAAMNRAIPNAEMRKIGAGPNWAVGSVHAVTEDGHVMFASMTGSQLAAHAYGADRVIWVVGAQKIVKNIDEGMKRLYEYCLPLESERARKAYGIPGSAVNKILIINKEVQPGRLTMILVKQKLGF